MGAYLDKLKSRLSDVHNLNRTNSVLGWDQQTYMPPGGSQARGEMMATIAGLAHDMFVSDETGDLLQHAADEVKDLPYDSFDASLVRVCQRDYNDDRRIPSALVTELTQHAVVANGVWVRARAENQYSLFAPYLEKTIDLSRRLAESLGYESEIYDALLNQFEPGMKTSEVTRIFDDLKSDLVPLVHAIAERADRVDDRVLHQAYDEGKQEAFGRSVATAFGFDFNRGRQDRTVHPFETSFSRNDVRITTRFEPDFLPSALFSTMHEAGHAMYEQGVGEELEGTLLARGTSLGLHESQSRLWENVVGRSRGFWEHYYPTLQETFPEQLRDTDLEAFYRAINKVEPSLIRVEADEVTYNLHIMLRFEMEQDLLNGVYGVAEAPSVWNDRMREYLGIVPPNDTLGILQDVHWSGGVMGYFPTYSLGTILSLQLYDKAVQDRPQIPDEIRQGEFSSLLSWLGENVYIHGRKYEPPEIVQRATGEPLQSRSYMRYLREKYGAIYGIGETAGVR